MERASTRFVFERRRARASISSYPDRISENIDSAGETPDVGAGKAGLMGFLKRKDNLFGDSELARVMSAIVAFRDERDWGQFHSPRNLAAALAVEASELQELMLWKTEDETEDFLASASGRREATYEVADVLIYALLFCNALGIEPVEAIRYKLVENARKYPVDAAKGNAVKYTQLPQLANKEGTPGGS